MLYIHHHFHSSILNVWKLIQVLFRNVSFNFYSSNKDAFRIFQNNAFQEKCKCKSAYRVSKEWISSFLTKNTISTLYNILPCKKWMTLETATARLTNSIVRFFFHFNFKLLRPMRHSVSPKVSLWKSLLKSFVFQLSFLLLAYNAYS